MPRQTKARRNFFNEESNFPEEFKKQHSFRKEGAAIAAPSSIQAKEIVDDYSNIGTRLGISLSILNIASNSPDAANMSK